MISSFWINYILICILFYLIGSIPTAYIVIKYLYKKDIRIEGSGNCGAMNSYEVSNSKTVGIVVFLVDFLKGFVPAFLILIIFRFSLSLSLIPLIFIVIGHDFSIWLGFKGGRGLATSAGIISVINFWIIILWFVIYLISYVFRKNVHIGNVTASLFQPIVLIFIFRFISEYTIQHSEMTLIYNFELIFALCSSLSLLILLKHLNPIIHIIQEYKNRN